MTRTKTGGRAAGTPNRAAADREVAGSFPPEKHARAGARAALPPPVGTRVGGRPRYEPNDKDRKVAEVMTACGIEQDAIIAVLGISKPTLRKYYRRELETALAKANAQIGGKLFAMAMAGDIAAVIFWLKTRARWSERIVVEDAATEDVDVATMSDAELNARIAQLQRHPAARKTRAVP